MFDTVTLGEVMIFLGVVFNAGMTYMQIRYLGKRFDRQEALFIAHEADDRKIHRIQGERIVKVETQVAAIGGR